MEVVVRKEQKRIGRPRKNNETLKEQQRQASQRYRINSKTDWLNYINAVKTDLILPITSCLKIVANQTLDDVERLEMIEEVLKVGLGEFNQEMRADKFPVVATKLHLRSQEN